ncbi:MAG: hypothetical protein ACC662_12075, partial [Planctomycetota bacterium]
MRHATIPFAALVLASPAFAGAARAKDLELRHDDGRPDDRRSTAGGGHVVSFTRPSDPFVVTGVRIHGERYGGAYDPFLTVARVSLRDAAWRPLATTFVPYDAWPRGRAGWADVVIPPCSVPEAFYVVVEYFPTGTKGVYQSIDTGAAEGSYAGTLAGLGRPLPGGGWMIRVLGSKKIPQVVRPDLEDTVVLVRGEGEPIGRLSAAGRGHALRFRTRKRPLLVSVSIFGARYGRAGGFFHVFVCDRKLKILARSSHPYDLFSTGDLEWVDVPIPATRVPREFQVVVCFDPTATKGVYVGKWKEKGGHSLLAYPGRSTEKLAPGEGWMIRATMAKSAGKSRLAAPAAPPPASGPDASEIAALREAVDRAEVEEKVNEANGLVARLAETDPEAAARLGRFDESPHFLLRRVGMTDEAAASLLRLMEAAYDVLSEQFQLENVAGVEGKKIHLHVTLGKGLETKLFTSPRSPDYSLIVLRGDAKALRAPTRGGPHVVYGFCHELGHVILGWEDSQHQ